MFVTRPWSGRTPGRDHTWDRATAPGGRPRRGCRPRRARRRAPSTTARRRRGSGDARCSPPGARSSETASPDAVSIVTPASPGALWSASSSWISTSCRRARAWPNSRCRELRQRLGLPAEPRREPAAEQQRGGERVLPVADGDRGDAAERRAQRRRVERGRDALAPRRRAQPREVDDVGVLGELAPRAASDSRDVRLVLGVDEHDLRQPPQRVDRLGVAVRRPHHRREVGDQQRVDDRVELGQVPRADVELHALAGDRDVARAAARRRRCRRPPTRRASCARPRPRTARAATGGSGRRAGSGSRSRRGTGASTTTTTLSTRAGTNGWSEWWCSTTMSRSAASILAGVVSRSDQTSSISVRGALQWRARRRSARRPRPGRASPTRTRSAAAARRPTP